MLSCFETGVLDPSLTCTVNVDGPAAVGVPEIVAPFSDKPAGSVPVRKLQVYVPVPPFAASVSE